MKRAFTLAEILMVVAIIGILAALALPIFNDHTQKAKESAAKDNLRLLRNAIEIYAAQHNDVAPGYPDNDPTQQPHMRRFFLQMTRNNQYLSAKPANPFNSCTTIKMVGNSEDFPTSPFVTDLYGWIYKPATKTIKLNWEGTDSQGVAYFDY